jgi:hypothetical protein
MMNWKDEFRLQERRGLKILMDLAGVSRVPYVVSRAFAVYGYDKRPYLPAACLVHTIEGLG